MSYEWGVYTVRNLDLDLALVRFGLFMRDAMRYMGIIFIHFGLFGRFTVILHYFFGLHGIQIGCRLYID